MGQDALCSWSRDGEAGGLYQGRRRKQGGHVSAKDEGGGQDRAGKADSKGEWREEYTALADEAALELLVSTQDV